MHKHHIFLSSGYQSHDGDALPVGQPGDKNLSDMSLWYHPDYQEKMEIVWHASCEKTKTLQKTLHCRGAEYTIGVQGAVGYGTNQV